MASIIYFVLIILIAKFCLPGQSTVFHHTAQDQDFIDLFDQALEEYDTNFLHYKEFEDFGIYRMMVASYSHRFYRMVHNQTMVSSTAHSPNLDFGHICLALDNHVAINLFGSDHWSKSLLNRAVLVNTPCLGSDSLGNFLSSYFENLMCALTVGVDYMAIGFIYDPAHFVPYSFFDQLPVLVKHHSPTNKNIMDIKSRLKDVCKCPGSCHERPYALWFRGINLIKPILTNAVQSYLRNSMYSDHNYTTILTGDLVSNHNVTSLPLIPDAAIHYRCSDNFIGHYGFLPFKVFNELIPKTAKTIYVLAENRDRKNKFKKYLPPKCDSIFSKMFEYLMQHFPQATILIRRGGDLYVDMARLAFAETTICSISTFCLWPAIIAGKRAHFPKTGLLVGGETSIDLGFHWIIDPPALLGAHLEHFDVNRLVQKLSS